MSTPRVISLPAAAISAGVVAQPNPPLDYASALLSATQLNEMTVPQRPSLLGKWLKEGDLGFVFAARGVGKTWLSLLLAHALTTGTALGQWEAGNSPRRVLYIDGEMALSDSQLRARAVGICCPRFLWLHHEHLFNTTEQTLNIASEPCRNAIDTLLTTGDVVIFDNLSSLCRGVAENDNDAWETLLPWILSLRRRMVTVIIVHHAGRNKEMRGASRREDAANWILRLADATEDDDRREKTIQSSFTKCRGCQPSEAQPLRWTMDIVNDKLTYTCKLHSGPDALMSLIAAGVSEPRECAEALGAIAPTVSKWMRKLIDARRAKVKGRKYFPANEEVGDEND